MEHLAEVKIHPGATRLPPQWKELFFVTTLREAIHSYLNRGETGVPPDIFEEEEDTAGERRLKATRKSIRKEEGSGCIEGRNEEE